MHVCFITSEYPKNGYPHGGFGSFVHIMSNKLAEADVKVSVVGINTYTHKDEVEIFNNLTVYRLRPNKIKGMTWYLNSKSINKKLREIHLQTPISIVETSELGLAFIKKVKSIKYVIRLHGGHHFFAEAEDRKISKWRGLQEKLSFRKADGFIAVSEFVKNHTSRYLSFGKKPITTIANLIDLRLFRPNPRIKIKSKTILFAGTVCEKKGVHNLITAFAKVKAKVPDSRLIIIGRDWFYPNGNSYIDFLKRQHIPNYNDLEQHITFLGPLSQDKLLVEYAKAELCCFPSLMETLGMVAPEAMAMNKLVVYTNQGPGPEIIEHNKTGLLCNPHNSDDIAEKLIWALKNGERCKAIGIQAGEHIRKVFDPLLLLEQNMNFYREIIKS